MCSYERCVHVWGYQTTTEIRVRYWVKEVPEDGLSIVCSLRPIRKVKNNEDENEDEEEDLSALGEYEVGHYRSWNGDMVFTVDAGADQSLRDVLRLNVREARFANLETEGFARRIGAVIAALVILAVLW